MENKNVNLKKIFLSQTAKDAAVLFLGNTISSILAIAFTIISARILGPSSWGVVASLIAFMAIINAIGDFGLGASLFKFRESVSQIFTLRLLTAIVIFALVFLFGNRLALVSGLGIASYLLFDFLVFFEQSEKKFKRASVFIVSSNLVRIVLVLGLYFTSAISVVTILVAYAVSPLLVFLVLYFQNNNKLKLSLDFKRLKGALKFSGWMGVNRIIGVVQGRADTLLVVSLLGTYEAGVFAAAKQLALGVPLVIGSFATVLAPRFGTMQKTKLKKYFFKTVYLSFGLAGGLVLGIMISPYVINLFGSEYQPATEVLQGLLAAYLPFVLATPAVNLLIYGFSRPNLILILSLLQLAIFLIINYFYLPILGTSAAIVALGAINLLQLIYSYCLAFYYLHR